MFVYKFEAFSTPCEIQLDISNRMYADEISALIHLQTKYFEQKYSFFHQDSELYKFNNRSTNELEIDLEFYNILLLTEFYAKITHGTFDVATAGTINAIKTEVSYQLYKKQRTKILPYASFENIILENRKVKFTNFETKVDLGGFIKEYALDYVILILQQYNIQNALVNFGGDIAVLGKFYDKKWNIEIINNSADSKVISLKNAICTSGHSLRYRAINNKNISHIQSKQKICEKSNQQVSITAPTAVDAGVWSTALLINPKLVPPKHIHVV